MADLFNARELATLFWMGVLLFWIVSRPSYWSSIRNLIKAAFARQLTVFYILMIIYLAIVIEILVWFYFWKLTDLKLTIIWFFTSGLAMAFRYAQERDHNFVGKILGEQVAIIAIIEFVVNLYSFSIWVELITIPLITFVVVMDTVAGFDEKHRAAKKLFSGVLVAYGLMVFMFTLAGIVRNSDQYITIASYKEFLLPIILTAAFLPFVYLAALYSTYEQIFLRLQYIIEDETLIPYAKRTLRNTFGLNLALVGRWSKTMNALRLKNRQEIDQAIGKFKTEFVSEENERQHS